MITTYKSHKETTNSSYRMILIRMLIHKKIKKKTITKWYDFYICAKRSSFHVSGTPGKHQCKQSCIPGPARIEYLEI